MQTFELTSSQAAGLQSLCDEKRNLFITGSPGTGKSFLINQFLKIKRQEEIPVVASTGAAAILVGGRTFHSFFALGIMQGGAEAVFERGLKDSRLRKRLNRIHTLVIDEVSMLSKDTFDCAEALARVLRQSDEPWGGLRIIAVGDFAQLPPISKSRTKEWGFLGRAWAQSNFKWICLEEVKRTEDREFLEILAEVRWGQVTPRVEAFLNSRLLSEEDTDSRIPHLFPRRHQTDAFNKMRLEEIDSPPRIYETRYGGSEMYIERLKRDAPIPPQLELKEGALVMLRMNDPKQRYVNGTVGIISEMEEDQLLVEIKGREVEIEPFSFSLLDGDGKEAAYAVNFPLNLAYASTIHKIQGTTLDRFNVDLQSLWEPGQAYVALSRASRGDSLSIMGWDKDSIIADSMVRDFYANGISV